MIKEFHEIIKRATERQEKKDKNYIFAALFKNIRL
jgi:hypothetical protein